MKLEPGTLRVERTIGVELLDLSRLKVGELILHEAEAAMRSLLGYVAADAPLAGQERARPYRITIERLP